MLRNKIVILTAVLLTLGVAEASAATCTVVAVHAFLRKDPNVSKPRDIRCSERDVPGCVKCMLSGGDRIR
jgi:hypothetical protein